MGIITLLKKAIDRKHQIIKAHANSDNPQIKELKHRAEGELIAYLACLDALRGDKAMLRISAGK